MTPPDPESTEGQPDPPPREDAPDVSWVEFDTGLREQSRLNREDR
ncbi:hypothetical protein [Mycolicibacterium sphagni]|nr:hypothetical protein [Mycolicibacterium sphagni]